VVVALETTVARRTRPYLAALLVLLALTGVVLVSAALRLRLYQDAYGWTELRLYVLMTIGTLAVTLVLMAVLAARGRMRWLGHGLAVIGVVSLITLNLVAPAAFVAERNVERVIDPSLVPADGHAGLDAAYLRVLPDDAVPVLVGALPALPATERQAVLPILRERQAELATDPAFASPAAWNLGREQARAALSELP
jgi:two-component system, OmpR family, sensor histidine kinase BaeS